MVFELSRSVREDENIGRPSRVVFELSRIVQEDENISPPTSDPFSIWASSTASSSAMRNDPRLSLQFLVSHKVVKVAVVTQDPTTRLLPQSERSQTVGSD